jgi:hypothetical protein
MSKVNTAKQSILEPSQKSSLKIDGVSTKRVKFDRLELQEYPYELGDNPSTYGEFLFYFCNDHRGHGADNCLFFKMALR